MTQAEALAEVDRWCRLLLPMPRLAEAVEVLRREVEREHDECPLWQEEER